MKNSDFVGKLIRLHLEHMSAFKHFGVVIELSDDISSCDLPPNAKVLWCDGCVTWLPLHHIEIMERNAYETG